MHTLVDLCDFRFAIFKKLSTIEVVFVIPDLCLFTVYWMGAFQKRGHFLSPERAAHTSPGQRPGNALGYY